MDQRKAVWPEVLTSVLAGLWLAAFPLWQDLSYSHITRAKWLGALALCGVSLVSMLTAVIILAVKGELRQHLRFHPARLIAVAYFLWVALSAWQGRLSDASNSRGELVVWMGAVRYEGLLTQLCYGLIFLTMSLFPPRMRPVLYASSAALMVFACVVAAQYAGVNVLGLYPTGRSIYTNYEFQGTIGNIDMINGYLCLVVPLLLGGFVLSRRGGWLWLFAGLTGVLLEWCMEVQSGMIAMLALAGMMIMLGLSRPRLRFRCLLAVSGMVFCMAVRQSVAFPWLDGVDSLRLVFSGKTAILLSFAALLAGLALILQRHPGHAMPWKVILALVAVFAAAVAAAVALLPIPDTAGGVWELHEILLGRPRDEFGSWRLGVWRHTLDMSRQSLWFGTGPDTFLYAMRAHLTEAGATLGENFDNPHNEYLAILSNNGLPALLLYLVLMALVMAGCLRRGLWQDGRRREISWPLALAASLICYALEGVFCFSICLVTPMFWAVMGMSVAWLSQQKGRPLMQIPRRIEAQMQSDQ